MVPAFPFLATASLSAETPSFFENSFLSWLTNSIFVTAITIGVIILIVRLCLSRTELIPGAGQNFLEAVIEGLYEGIESILGNKMARKAFSLLASLFIFILVANWFGLLPGVGSIGWNQIIDGTPVFVPLLRAPTADLNMTLALAAISMVLWFYWTMEAVGPFGFLKELFGVKGGMKGPVLILLVPLFFFIGLLEVVSVLVRPISLSFRLYGNVSAGENMMVTMINIGHMFHCPQWLTSIFSCIVPLPFFFLELLVGFLQAMIFTVLIIVYIQLSTAHEEQDH